MNLQHKKTSDPAHLKVQEPPWYDTPEAEQPAAASAHQTLFEPSAAERILARAGALQEVHGQMLSEGQIEAVAADLGIRPEFIRLAIEQEQVAAVSAATIPSQIMRRRTAKRFTDLTHGRTVALLAAYGLVAWGLMTMEIGLTHSISNEVALFATFLLPSLLALTLGALSRSRRQGIVSAAALGVTVIIVALLIFSKMRGAAYLPLFICVIGLMEMLSIIGAQARRVVSRRWVKSGERA